MACLAVAAGCGGGDWGTLSGVVKVDGQPVGPGTISLHPIDEQRAGATAKFGDDGRYAVMSAGRKEGAATGEYRVAIHGDSFEAELAGPPPESDIPNKYNDPAASGLTVTIEPGAKTFDFELSS